MTFSSRPTSGARMALGATLAAAAVLGASAAQAAGCGFQVCDDAGILQTFVGTAGADLDVLGASAFYNSTTMTLTAKMAGAIGTTAGGFYVWGLDTGSPIDFFKAEHDNPKFPDASGNVSADPLVGVGVNFDTFIVLKADGTGSINFFDPSHHSSALGASEISIDGDTISVTFRQDRLFFTNGFDITQVTGNVWPRNGGFRNDQVTDFAPDHSNFLAVAVPEPATWAMMIIGFGAIGSTLRRRRLLQAA